jgi:hypothetical protein
MSVNQSQETEYPRDLVSDIKSWREKNQQSVFDEQRQPNWFWWMDQREKILEYVKNEEKKVNRENGKHQMTNREIQRRCICTMRRR